MNAAIHLYPEVSFDSNKFHEGMREEDKEGTIIEGVRRGRKRIIRGVKRGRK